MNDIWQNILHEFHTPFTNSVLIFAVILFIILLVPLIFIRFKVPGIIGLIISGTIIGPHGLHLINKNSAVDLFSTIGLLYIMFIAGLELDLNEFRKNRNKSIVFGLLTFAIPIVIGLPVCLYLLKYEFSSALLIASMFATHTLIAYPIVQNLGISKNQAVAITVGGTILTDTAVLMLLAVISGAHQTGLTRSFWTALIISVLIFLFIVVLIIPKVSSLFFRRLEDEKYAHFIFVLSIVFFCAFLAELSGLEPIIGAFAAGLTLNRLIPHTSSLMNRIEFVGNSLFIPFFLISVGMLINLRVLTNGPEAVVVAITLTAVALLSKWIAARLSGIAFGFSKTQSNLMFGLSSAHAAATLAIILVGYNIGLIDEAALNGTVVLILITCVIASFVTERAGKKLLLHTELEPEMRVEVQRILVPVSNPQTMERLIDLATMMKNARDHSPIVALSVVKDDAQAQMRLVESRKLLEKAIIHAAAADQKIEITATIDRNVTNGIKRVTREKFITDIVIGWSEQKNIVDIIFGKTFDSLIKQTTQTLFITRFVMPLNVQQTLILICPTFAEKESGFYRWLASLFQTAFHLRAGVEVHGSESIQQAVRSYAESNKVTTPVIYKGQVDYAALLKQSSEVNLYDTFVFVLSRPGHISHNPAFDILPGKVASKFSRNNMLFVFPATSTANEIGNYEDENTGGILEQGLSLISRAGRIFKRS